MTVSHYLGLNLALPVIMMSRNSRAEYLEFNLSEATSHQQMWIRLYNIQGILIVVLLGDNTFQTANKINVLYHSAVTDHQSALVFIVLLRNQHCHTTNTTNVGI